jgi:glucan phosphoethanolaminetransferase (alkaline phosphatase superfamily)
MAILALAIVVGLVVGFWFYGIGRTMRETVSFNTTASLSGLVLGCVLPLLVLIPLFVAQKLWFREKTSSVSLLLVVFTVSLLVGSFASEVWILQDETRFSVEADKSNTLYSRPRSWPNQVCGLVFVPGEGIHSTD